MIRADYSLLGFKLQVFPASLVFRVNFCPGFLLLSLGFWSMLLGVKMQVLHRCCFGPFLKLTPSKCRFLPLHWCFV
jgi:hypothetical protein